MLIIHHLVQESVEWTFFFQIRYETSTFCCKYWCKVTTTFVYHNRRLCTTGALSKRWCTNSALSTRWILYSCYTTVHLYTLYIELYTIYSSIGYVPPHSYHHYPENSNQFPTGPTHQPTYHQPSHPGYPPPGHQYPPQHVPHYGHPPPNSSHHTSFPPHQYTGPRVQGSSYQGNNITVVLPVH